MPSLVQYEWLRGPRLKEELAIQEAMFPSLAALPFRAEDAAIAAGLYRTARRPRGRKIDPAIVMYAVMTQ